MISQNPDKLIDNALNEQVFPGIAVEVEQNDTSIYRRIAGMASVENEQQKLLSDALWDLASLTKVLCTTPVLLHLMENEQVSPKEHIGRFLPHLNEKLSVLELGEIMLHRSGLPPLPDMFRLFPNGNECIPDTALNHLFSIVPETNSEVVYSCTGYILLGLVAEAIGGKPLNQLFDVIIPTEGSLVDVTFNPTNRKRAVTEEYDPWRGRWLQGEVHDENAWTLGGVSGNAGLFGSLDGVSTLAGLFLNGGILNDKQILSDEMLELMTQPVTARPPRAFGFLCNAPDVFAGPGFSDRSFGHTGFTGVSLWFDPERSLKIVILTNRVHFGREKTDEKIRKFRKDFHGLFL